ncbi:MAG: hypothetical protein HOW73_14900 [Polyangiaceae bacterium]|nr:hypothetical protein [Polyangiaceae bacterium]
MPWRLCSLLVAVAVPAMLSAAACGAEVLAPTAEEACVLGGGEWGNADCGGGGDTCDVVVCELNFGEGCVCTEPGTCWDGTECVKDPSLAYEVCAAGGAKWNPSADCGGRRDACDLVACEHSLGPGCFCDDPGMCWNGTECIEGWSFEDQ